MKRLAKCEVECMSKKLLKILILSICVLFLAGCQNNTETKKDNEEDKKPEALELEKKENFKVDEDNQEEETEKPAESPDTTQTSKKVTVYASNENADGFVTKEVEAASVTEEWVIEQLIKNGTLPADVQAVSCKKIDVDGVASLELDMNSAFQKYVQSMGTAGEYVVVGSVTNTFLSAYDCQQVKITVEGKTLTTGHAEYPGYMTKFE